MSSKLPLPLRPFSQFATFEGRTGRAEFWTFMLSVYGIIILFFICIIGFGRRNGAFDLDRMILGYLRYGILLNLFNLLILVPFLSVSVRRLHDTGRSGWWLSMPMIATFFGYFFFFIFKGMTFFHLLVSISQQLPDPLHDPIDPVEIFKLELPAYRLILPWILLPSLLAQLYIYKLCLDPSDPKDNRFGAFPVSRKS